MTQVSIDPRWVGITEKRIARTEDATRAMTSRVAQVESMLASLLAHHEALRLARHAAQMRRRRVRIGMAWFTVVLVVVALVVLASR